MFGPALAVLVTTGVVPRSNALAAVAGVVVTQDTVAAGQAQGRRPFEHRYHAELPCLGCHGSGATHRMTRIRGPLDCAACHHDPERGLACTQCHGPDRVPAERTVSLAFRLRVVPGGVTRQVVFRHAAHIAAASGLVCRDCHTTEVTLARNRECASCHVNHHGGGAECAQCHAAPPAGAHTAAVHLGCAGSACHDPARAPTPVSSRALCLFCHPDRRDHEVGGACAVCHRIPGAPALAPEGGP